MNEYTFRNFVLTIKSAGFVTNKLINSQMTLDFAIPFILYLMLIPILIRLKSSIMLQNGM